MEKNKTNKDLHNLSFDEKINKKNIYNEWADTYEDYVKNLNYLGPKNLVKKLTNYLNNNNTINKIKILDFGCGTGLLGVELYNNIQNKDIDGIDISENMIRESEKKNIYENIWNIDLFKNKLNIDFEYDIIVSCGVFLEGHVSFEMIDILVSYLKKGGIICFSVRDTFKEENVEEFNKYVKENKKINIIDDIYMDYLPNVKCKLLIIKRN